MFGHPLEQLHTWPYMGEDVCHDVSAGQDRTSPAYRQFYRKFPRIAGLYGRCLRAASDLLELDSGDVLYQAVPNIRFHFPGSRAIAEPHTDWQLGHQAREVSFWVPLTETDTTNGLWLGRRLQDFDPRSTGASWRTRGSRRLWTPCLRRSRWNPWCRPLGKMLVWDSVHRVHANTINTFGTTRVSIDFRLLPKNGTKRPTATTPTAGGPCVPEVSGPRLDMGV